MSSHYGHPVDTLVYPTGTSGNRIGIVRAQTTIQHPGGIYPAVEVEWRDGKRTVEDLGFVTPIDRLIDEHLEKMNGHLERRDRAADELGATQRSAGPVVI